eukprot:1028334-Pelagomonas_calceolata.AAC.4
MGCTMGLTKGCMVWSYPCMRESAALLLAHELHAFWHADSIVLRWPCQRLSLDHHSCSLSSTIK